VTSDQPRIDPIGLKRQIRSRYYYRATTYQVIARNNGLTVPVLLVLLIFVKKTE